MKYSQYITLTSNREWINKYPWLNEWALNEFGSFDILYTVEATDRLINNNVIDNILEIEKINSVVTKLDILNDSTKWGDSNNIVSNSNNTSNVSNSQNYQGFNAEGVYSKDSANQTGAASTTTNSNNSNLLNTLISLKNIDLINIYKNLAKIWRSLVVLCYNI